MSYFESFKFKYRFKPHSLKCKCFALIYLLTNFFFLQCTEHLLKYIYIYILVSTHHWQGTWTIDIKIENICIYGCNLNIAGQKKQELQLCPKQTPSTSMAWDWLLINTFIRTLNCCLLSLKREHRMTQIGSSFL